MARQGRIKQRDL